MSDEELYDYLMTSDLHEDWSPEDLKSMILFFRKKVREAHSSKSSLEYTIDELQRKLDFKDRLVLKKDIERKDAERKAERLQNKKLTFKERLFGKIM